MNDDYLPPGSIPCNDVFWQTSPLTRNADYIKVSYINRYCGPHLKKVASAAPHWELFSMKSGTGSFHFSQHSLSVKAGTLVLFPPDCAHSESFPAQDSIWIGFEGSVMENVERGPFSINSSVLVETVSRLWQLSERRFGAIGFEIDGGVLSILGGFFRALHENEKHSATDPVGIAIDWLHAHLADEITFSRVAELAGVSEGHFYRLFKRQTGLTPTQYLNTIRIEYAVRMLRLPHSRISEVAAACGFKDPLYFSRIFKRHTGQCPDTYRHAHQA